MSRLLKAYGPRQFLIYSDAAGFGRLGATIFVDGNKHVFPTHLPAWMAGADGLIEDFELARDLYGLRIAEEFDPERAVILFCGNTCATGSLVRGCCKSPVSRALCSAIWSVAARCALHVWIEHVAGALNPPDPPPRGCPACAKPFSVAVKRFVVPTLFRRILSSRESLLTSQTKIPAESHGFTQSWPCPMTDAGPTL